MKKILLGLAVIIACSTCNVYAAQGYIFTVDNVQPVYSQTVQMQDLPYGEYLRYYELSPNKINAEFIQLSKDEEKQFLKKLSKEEKEEYKYAKKIQKIVKKGDWNKVFSKYPNYFPAYLQYYNLNYEKGNYAEALRILNRINSMDKRHQIYKIEMMNYSFGVLYFMTGQYTQALNYFKLYEHSGEDFIISSMANCYYSLGNYKTAIEYCKKLKQPQYQDKELLYGSYLKLNNKLEANKYAKMLLNENYSFENLMRVQESSNDDATRLSYCYKARGLTQNETEMYDVNQIIATLEQKKLDKAASKYTQFIKVPKWSEFENQLPENMTEAEISAKQDEFFKTANTYLSKYSGQQLTNAFNSLNQDFNTYVQNKKTQYYQEQQLQAQKALVAEQQRNNLLQQQLIREQQEQNYLQRQRLYYYQTRPRYYAW